MIKEKSPFPIYGNIMYALIDKNSKKITGAIFANSKEDAENIYKDSIAIEVTDNNSPWKLYSIYEGDINA